LCARDSFTVSSHQMGSCDTSICETSTTPVLKPPLHPNQNYCSKGTLIIVPINLPAQWLCEIKQFYKDDTYTLVKLLKSTDLKHVTMETLLEADIILTTIHFIKANKTYNEMVSGVINSRGVHKKSRALFRSFSRNKNIVYPIIQLIHWKRIIVDEIHEVKDKDLKLLKNLSTDVFWGLTATPIFNSSDDLNHINFMHEDVIYHPNIYRAFVQQYMKGNKSAFDELPDNALRLVKVSDMERKNIENKSDEETILLASSFDDRISFFTERSELKSAFINPEDKNINTNTDLLHTEQKTILLSTCVLLGIWCTEILATNKVNVKLLHNKAIQLLYNEQKQKINDVSALSESIAQTKRRKIFMEESLKHLESGTEVCPICYERTCSAVTRCGHIFCTTCISEHYKQKNNCPICKNESSLTDVFRILQDDENSKLLAIKHVIDGVKEPTIVFAQFKKVLKHIRLLVQKTQRILLLEGNVSQRASILTDFKTNGGILLLCTTDSFAGIRLPNVKYIIFSHALSGEYSKVKSIEMQAIGRTVQTNNQEVNVMSFVTADTGEEIIWRTNHPITGAF